MKREVTESQFITAQAIEPLMDSAPVDIQKLFKGPLSQRVANLKSLSALAKSGVLC